MTEYHYQQLTQGDAQLMRRLREVMAVAFDEQELYHRDPPSDAYLEQELSNERTLVLIARDGERVIGGLIAYVLPKFERARSEIYLYDLAVDAQYRRQGVATQLIRELQALGKKQGAWVIFVQADAVDTPAIKLYESLATAKEAPFHFDIPIE